MARRTRSTSTVEETTEAPVSEAVEASTEETTVTHAAPEADEFEDAFRTSFEEPATETPAEPVATETAEIDPTKSADEAKAEAKPEVDLTEFEAAVETALGEKDTSTGTLPEAQIEAVKAAYRNLDGAKAKNRAKTHLNEKLKDALNSMDIVYGKAVMVLTEAVQSAGSAGKPAAERTPADPRAALIQKLALVNLAYNLVLADRPEGLSEEDATSEAGRVVEEHNEKALEYVAWLNKSADERGTEPEVDAMIKKAAKIAQGKSVSASTGGTGRTGGSHEGPRGNIALHIQEAFADKGEGDFLLVNEIAKFTSTQYPNGNASPGAVSARLFPSSGKVTVEGVRPGQNDAGRRGAYKDSTQTGKANSN